MNIPDAVIRLHKSWRFIGPLIARLDFIEDTSGECPTAMTDGYKYIKINPAFVAGLSRDDLTILLAHEVMHIILRNTYGPLSSPQYPDIWNIAEDIAVNSILDEHYIQQSRASAVTIHKIGIWPKNDTVSFSNVVISDVKSKTVSQIYWELISQTNPGNGGDGSQSLCGYSSMDDHSDIDNTNMTSAERAKARNDWKRKIIQAAMSSQGAGKGDLPGMLENLIENITEAKIPWRERLKNMMIGTLITDSSYSIRNKRSCALGVVLPGYVRNGLDVIVHLDTSGSTYNMLAEFLSEIKGIASVVPGSEITVIQCDAEIQSVDSITADFSEFHAAGFGGTSHRPVIDYINDMPNKPKMFISFTDGYSDIEACYNDLEGNIYKVICLPECCASVGESLSPYGEILVID